MLAAIWADLEVTPIGTQSRLADELAGSPILRRTVERVAAAHHITGVHVCCPAEQQQRCAELLTGTPAVIHAATIPPAPWSSLVQPARKWALDSWRGGLGGTTAFDEYTHAPLLAGLLRAVPAEAVLVVPPASPAFLPGLADEMIDTRARAGTDIRLVFTQRHPASPACCSMPTWSTSWPRSRSRPAGSSATSPTTPPRTSSSSPVATRFPPHSATPRAD